MLTADMVVLIVFGACLLFGALFGFSRGLRWFTSGAFGIIISIIITYFLIGIVLDWGFVKALMEKLVDALSASDSWICSILLNLRADLIVVTAILFTAVQILRMIVVSVIARIMESDNKIMRVLNSILGVAFFILFAIVMLLVVFQIIAWINGTDGTFYQGLVGSTFGLDKIFLENPLNSIFESIRMGAGAGAGAGE